VAGIGKAVKFGKGGYDFGSERIEMNIANEFCKIGVFLADYRLVTVLKELACSVMTMVERNNISCKELPHEEGYSRRTASKEKVGMIGNKGPGITNSFSFRQKGSQPI
jgi:hypothetical protein